MDSLEGIVRALFIFFFPFSLGTSFRVDYSYAGSFITIALWAGLATQEVGRVVGVVAILATLKGFIAITEFSSSALEEEEDSSTNFINLLFLFLFSLGMGERLLSLFFFLFLPFSESLD